MSSLNEIRLHNTRWLLKLFASKSRLVMWPCAAWTRPLPDNSASVRLGHAELRDEVLFVTESRWSDDDDDDGGDDSDDFTPSPEQQVCNVAQCLFQQH